MSNPKINIEDLFNLPSAVIYNPDRFNHSTSVSTDTRTIKKNSVYVALKGKKFDGHTFVNQAIEKGANAIIINKNKLKDFDKVEVTIITVKDTKKSYGDLARIWRSKLTGKIIGITGSNGKTSTKEMLAKIFEQNYSVCKTLANNNNQIGVPLTIFSANNNHDFIVLEMGTNHFGEIEFIAKIAKPDIALITNIGDSHLEYFKNQDGVAKEKLALFHETINAGGKVFVNTDDQSLKRKTKSLKNKITFGFNGSPDVKGKILGLTEDGRPKIQITFKSNKFEVALGVCGLPNAKNFLAATAIALFTGIPKTDIKKAASKLCAVDNRLNVIKKKNFILINDTYNANPESMKAAFEFMASLKTERRIAVLGNMFELGERAIEAHQSLAVHLKRNKINEVYSIGNLMKHLDDELKKTKIISRHFRNRKSLEQFLTNRNYDNSIVLVKGSHGMKMEEFLQAFTGKN
ncbi:MAG: UDP-N-acetylmuramoyl-tripeptide--D-alanyl-D-alanine ligase [Ignavibacteriales bacterium]|nr:UDP-N-acetylmuramoyl-tripeptide--D-alanyl-D-alanine ligase [Ignavibacteriales bacterium]